MKTIFRFYIVLGFLMIIPSLFTFSQVSINTDGTLPEPSAGLDINFTNKGLLPPRVALTALNEAGPVASPASGLFVYNTATSGTSPYNVMPGYYCWNGARWVAVIVQQGTNPGDMLYWNGTQWVSVPAGSNGQILAFSDGIPAWVRPYTLFWGNSITITHVAGTVAPVTKTVTYGTVTNIPGEPFKFWITSNLGADHQATAVNDATEASAGWYWQFNRKQGYKHDGSTRTPSTTWIYPINENSNWQPVNDPCTLELGSAWRIPTYSEWYNVDNTGGWTNWNGLWNSNLKMHAAGNLYYGNGDLVNRGSVGGYWSSGQYNSYEGWFVNFTGGSSSVGNSNKADAFTLRCIRE